MAVLYIENKLESYIYNPKQIFVSGEYYDAYTYIQSIFEEANTEIIIIDNYVNRSILDRLVVKKQNVKVKIYTDINYSKILGRDIQTFNRQYGNLDVLYTLNVHDRFYII